MAKELTPRQIKERAAMRDVMIGAAFGTLGFFGTYLTGHPEPGAVGGVLAFVFLVKAGNTYRQLPVDVWNPDNNL